ncbi:hypothetical protein WMF20_35530 [Sorangium sp. So ce834]|uniref:hypothetical protein n=1 Tax=Sorangium sp. So ce834 TaxID=3133321 RepID=UPI003F622D84
MTGAAEIRVVTDGRLGLELGASIHTPANREKLDTASLLVQALSASSLDPVEGMLEDVADDLSLLAAALRPGAKGEELLDTMDVSRILSRLERYVLVCAELHRRLLAEARGERRADREERP